MAWLHPLFGAVLVGALLWVGSQGLRARHRAPYARTARTRHARYAPIVYALVATVAVVGTASVPLFRDDLEPTRSWHFRIGWLVVLLLTGGALTSKRLGRSPAARAAHPWLGLAAMLLAAVGLALGLGILP